MVDSIGFFLSFFLPFSSFLPFFLSFFLSFFIPFFLSFLSFFSSLPPFLPFFLMWREKNYGRELGLRGLISIVLSLRILLANLFHFSSIFQLALLNGLAKPTWEVSHGRCCAGRCLNTGSLDKKKCAHIFVSFLLLQRRQRKMSR